MRVFWRTAGGICSRVAGDLEARSGRGRFDGLRSVGVDETSYKKGRRYMTVVVDHDRGCVVWAAEGHGKRWLNDFLDLLTEEQRAGIEVVTADGARRIAETVEGRLPKAELAVDPFHVASWATDALDDLRREAWREACKEAKGEPEGKRKRGRPRKDEEKPKDEARQIKGLRCLLLKNPEDLTEGQAATLDELKRAGTALWCV